MIKGIAKQFLPPILYSALQRASRRKVAETSYSPAWHFIKAGILGGRAFFADPRGGYWQNEIIDGNYDQFFFDSLNTLTLQGVLVPITGATVWDVGAHVGYYSLAFAALVGPSGHVVAFEPNPYNSERLRQNLARNQDLGQRITLMTCALGSVDGEADFVFSRDIDDGSSSGSHLTQAFAPEEPGVYQAFRQTRVPVAMADTLLRDKRVLAPVVIKLDVEGAESLVLAGAQQLLGSRRPVLLIEVHHITAMHDTLNILLRQGYQTRIVNEAPNSSSRCFIVARPERGDPLKNITTAGENVQ